MREIALTQNLVTLIDDEDYERVTKYNWYALWGWGQWYAAMCVNGKHVLMHRFILRTNQYVDHRDGDSLNNTRANLRSATKSQNAANSGPRLTRGRTSQFKGVSWNWKDEKWRAQIEKDRKGYSLGRFDSEIEAAHAYDAKAKELFGEFAYLNFPEAA